MKTDVELPSKDDHIADTKGVCQSYRDLIDKLLLRYDCAFCIRTKVINNGSKSCKICIIEIITKHRCGGFHTETKKRNPLIPYCSLSNVKDAKPRLKYLEKTFLPALEAMSEEEIHRRMREVLDAES